MTELFRNPAVSAIPHDLRPVPKKRKPLAHPTPNASTDPFAQLGDADIQRVVNRITGMYGTPMSDTDIQSRAQGLIDPIVAAITGNINSRARQSSEAIRGNSESLAKSLAGVDYGAPYATAKSEQAAVDAALQQSLTGGGTALAGDLQSRLAQINDPAVAAAGSAVAQTGAANGNTALAHGSSSLSNLIAQAAAAKSYGQKQPGIARLTGLQDIAGVEQGAVNEIGSQTADIQKLLPQIVQNFRGENTNLRDNKASAAAQLYGLLTGQNITKATAKAGLANTAFDNTLAAQNAASDNAYRAATLGISQQNADTSATRAANAAKTAATKAAAKKKSGGFTPQQTETYKSKAYSIIEDSAHGYTVTEKDANGQPVDVQKPGVSIQQAVDRLKRAGVPESIYGPLLKKAYAELRAKARAKNAPLTAAQQAATDAAFNPVSSLIHGD